MHNKVKLRQEFESFRNKKAIKYAEMERLAKLLGRTIKKRGKHPTWVNSEFPELRPLSIPHHGHGGVLVDNTANNILNQLEEDMIKIEESK